MSGMRDIGPVLPDGTFYVLEYNGFRFDPAATETLGISIKPIQDDSKRTIKFVEYDISVKTIVYLSYDERYNPVNNAVMAVSTDSKIEGILQKLTAQAGQFVYQGKGIGRLNVNISQKGAGINDDGVWDAAWGPTPYDVNAKPVGDTLAWEITWSCRVSIPKCYSASYQDDIMAFNYSVDYSTDYGGYTTRTIRGHLEVPMTRDAQGDRLLKHKDADKFREQIVINIPPGFRDAGGGSYSLSQDRRRLDFYAVHVQLPGVVPPLGVLKCSMSMKTQNHKALNFVSWFFTIDATYEMASGKFQSVAALHFRRVIVDRINRLNKIATNKNMKVNDGASEVPKKPKDPTTAESNFGAATKGAIAGGAIGGFIGPAGVPIGAIIGGAYGIYSNYQTPAVPTPPPAPAADNSGTGTETANQPGFWDKIAGLIGSGKLGQGQGLDGEANVFTPDDMIQGCKFPPGCFVCPIFYSAEDPDAYGKPMAKFSCTITVVGTVRTLLNEGLWEPIKGTPTYDQWKKSLGNIWGPRGIAGLKFDASEDVIIDLCRNTDSALVGKTAKDSKLQGKAMGWVGEFSRTYKETTGEEFASYLGNNLWMKFENDISYRQIDDIIKTKKLPTDSVLDGTVSLYGSQTVPDRWFENQSNQFNIETGGVTIENQTRFETRVAPDYEITMEGYAIKLGEPALSPELVSIAGVPCVPIDRVSKTEVVGNSFYPVYRTSWVKKYLLPQHIGRVVEPGSPEAASLRSASGGGTSSLKSVGA
jgi:hypothetical protein